MNKLSVPIVQAYDITHGQLWATPMEDGRCAGVWTVVGMGSTAIRARLSKILWGNGPFPLSAARVCNQGRSAMLPYFGLSAVPSSCFTIYVSLIDTELSNIAQGKKRYTSNPPKRLLRCWTTLWLIYSLFAPE